MLPALAVAGQKQQCRTANSQSLLLRTEDLLTTCSALITARRRAQTNALALRDSADIRSSTGPATLFGTVQEGAQDAGGNVAPPSVGYEFEEFCPRRLTTPLMRNPHSLCLDPQPGRAFPDRLANTGECGRRPFTASARR